MAPQDAGQHRQSAAAGTGFANLRVIPDVIANQRRGEVVERGHHHPTHLARAALPAIRVENLHDHVLGLHQVMFVARALQGHIAHLLGAVGIGHGGVPGFLAQAAHLGARGLRHGLYLAQGGKPNCRLQAMARQGFRVGGVGKQVLRIELGQPSRLVLHRRHDVEQIGRPGRKSPAGGDAPGATALAMGISRLAAVIMADRGQGRAHVASLPHMVPYGQCRPQVSGHGGPRDGHRRSRGAGRGDGGQGQVSRRQVPAFQIRTGVQERPAIEGGNGRPGKIGPRIDASVTGPGQALAIKGHRFPGMGEQ